MKKNQSILIGIFLLISSFSLNAQETVDCNTLMEFVKENCSLQDQVSCYNSSMLESVQSYNWEGTIVVIANIKSNKYDIYGKPYIFCDVPISNWTYFRNTSSNESWGKAFHEYIMDYKCDCN